MNQRARTRGASEVHEQQEIPGQEITHRCTEVHAPEVHAPDPLFRGGGRPYDAQEWQERLRLAVEKTLRARQARKAERAEFARRRAHGKAIGNAQRLRRARGGQEEEN